MDAVFSGQVGTVSAEADGATNTNPAATRATVPATAANHVVKLLFVLRAVCASSGFDMFPAPFPLSGHFLNSGSRRGETVVLVRAITRRATAALFGHGPDNLAFQRAKTYEYS
jgi:hypothetical protein